MMSLLKAGLTRNRMMKQINAGLKPNLLDPEVLLETTQQVFASAPAVQEHTFRMFESDVLIKFSGSTVLPIAEPALRHLSVLPTKKPDLTIYVWDSKSTGVRFPFSTEIKDLNETWRFINRRFQVLFLPITGHIYLMDNQENTAVIWLHSVEQIPLPDNASPFRPLWAWWSAKREMQLVHAAAIAGRRGAALLTGRGGSGKSSTAMMSLSSNQLKYLADDYCVVDFMNPLPNVHSLFCGGRINLPDRAHYPWLESAYAGCDDEKAMYILQPAFKEHLSLNAPLKALMAAKVVSGSQTRLVSISPIELLRSMAPSTLLQTTLISDSQQDMKNLAALSRLLPCYRLEMGANRLQVIQVLEEFLN